MMSHFDMPVVAENAAYYAAGAFALWKGGRPERLVAATLLIENSLAMAIQNPLNLSGPRYVSLLLELATLAVVLYVAFSTDLRWALLASALEILSTLTFIARIIDPTVGSWAYITVDIAISFILMGTVVYGAVAYDRRRLRISTG